MAEIDLLRSLPKIKRDITKRCQAKSPEIIKEAKKYGEVYFDGPREYGYGGYKYDGRWRAVARDIISHYGLKSGDKVLDVGCAKGFLVKDLMLECPGLEVFGLDVSEYALMYCDPTVVGRLHLGSADHMAFPNSSFDCVLAINVIHNFNRQDAVIAMKEIQRLSNGRAFVQVDSYHTPEQKKIFENWVLTADFHDYPEGWLAVFKEAGYTGDHFWTICE